MRKTDTFRIKVFLLLVWSLCVLWYFGRHFPIVNLPEIVLNGLMLMIVLLFFTAAGHRILSFFSLTFTSFAEECCFSFGIGSGVLMLVVFGLAVAGVVYKLLIVGLVVGLFLIVYKDARDLCVRCYAAVSEMLLQEQSATEVILLSFIGFAALVTFLAAATPPFFYDALAYHVAVPHKYLLLHGFHDIPHNHAAPFPMNLGMLFIIAMSFSDGMLVKLLSWSFVPLTALAVYGFAKPRWGPAYCPYRSRNSLSGAGHTG